MGQHFSKGLESDYDKDRNMDEDSNKEQRILLL
jgi:hypothetical protein